MILSNVTKTQTQIVGYKLGKIFSQSEYKLFLSYAQGISLLMTSDLNREQACTCLTDK